MRLAALAWLLAVCAAPLWAEPAPLGLSLGVNNLGGQVSWRFSQRWMGEFRYLTGDAESDTGKVHSSVFGLRGYRFRSGPGNLEYFAGAEFAAVSVDQHGTPYSATGTALGAFLGFQYRAMRRLSVGADIGPYVISLRERRTGVSDTTLDFVVNTFITYHVY